MELHQFVAGFHAQARQDLAVTLASFRDRIASSHIHLERGDPRVEIARSAAAYQANLLVIATSLSLARRPDRDGSGWRIARLDALTGITITGLVHWFLLHPLDHFRGWLWASDTLVHIVVPVLVVLGWLVFGPRRRVSIRVVLLGLIWPVVWLIYTLVVGAMTGWYPYFFLDVRESGAATVAVYCVAILILLLAVSCLFWLGDRWLPGRRPDQAVSKGGAVSQRRARAGGSRT